MRVVHRIARGLYALRLWGTKGVVLACGVDGDLFASVGLPLVFYDAVDEGEEGEVFAGADVFAGVDGGADLADEDGAGGDGGAGVDFDASFLCA